MEAQREFQHESIEDKESIIRYLQTLAEGFQKQKLEFRTGQERIILEPSGLILLEIKVKNRHRKFKLSLKFTWKDHQEKKEKTLAIEPVRE